MPNEKPRSPDDLDRLIAKRLRHQRVISGLSQTALATALGITFQQVQKYESGKNRISAGRLWQIANVMEVEIASFFISQDREKV